MNKFALGYLNNFNLKKDFMRIFKGVKRLTQKILLTCPKNITSIRPKFRSQNSERYYLCTSKCKC